ncbi:MAG: phage virion morphogenesis protein [Deferribacteraceae bacterium]|jgi:phage virion morphogenesis protein|nr:phage virion morphogenesis protein [Deferribacteraceae bacterium]
MNITFTLPDGSKFTKLINGIKELENTEPLMARISGLLDYYIEENFMREGRPVKWKPLSALYAEQKRKERGNTKILQSSGALKRSIVQSYGKLYAAVSTNKEYARIHHFGGVIRPKPGRRDRSGGKRAALKFGGRYFRSANIPARPFMTVTDGDKEEILTEIQDYIAKKLGLK